MFGETALGLTSPGRSSVRRGATRKEDSGQGNVGLPQPALGQRYKEQIINPYQL